LPNERAVARPGIHYNLGEGKVIADFMVVRFVEIIFCCKKYADLHSLVIDADTVPDSNGHRHRMR
jgi:hypothetical protein